MSRLCLDTSAYSNFKRGDERARQLIDAAEWVGVPAIVIGELWTGFLLGQQLAQNAAELRSFMMNAVVEELVVDSQVARTYAEIVADLRATGTPIPTNDIWIAALAARAGATVLTFDRHFESIARVGVNVLSS